MGQSGHPDKGWLGTDVMVLKIFSPKKLGKKLARLNQLTARMYKTWIKTLTLMK
jgi:hypothetical protein